MVVAARQIGSGVLRRVRRAVRRRRRPHVLVLAYHRVAEPLDPDPWKLAVTPGRFAEHLEVLMRHAEPVSLADIPSHARAGGGAPVVVITFDDAYSDLPTHALPILDAHSAPATVFVPTWCAEDGLPFWWDRLADALLGSGPRPDRLSLVADGEEVGGATGTAEERRSLHAALWRRLRDSNDAARAPVLDALTEWAGRPVPRDPLRRPLTWSELARFAESPLIELGGHTRTHAHLPVLALDEEEREIRGSFQDCSEIAGRPPVAFAYPYGAPSPHSPKIAQEAGFRFAFTAEPELTWLDSDPCLLPRFTVLDWDGAEFERRLRWRWAP